MANTVKGAFTRGQGSQFCCIYGYVWECERERERESVCVCVCVCSSIVWKAIDCMCSGDFSEQICWQQFPSLPSRLLTLVFSDSGCLVPVDHAEYGAPGNVHDSNHPSTMVRLLLPILLRVSPLQLYHESANWPTQLPSSQEPPVVQSLSHVWLRHPMDCSTPSSPVLHYLPEFAQIHIHWVSDAYLTISSSVFNLPSTFPSIRVISSESSFHIKWPKYWSFSFSICHPNEYSGLISIG